MVENHKDDIAAAQTESTTTDQAETVAAGQTESTTTNQAETEEPKAVEEAAADAPQPAEPPKRTAAETAAEAERLVAEAGLVNAQAEMARAKGNLWKARGDNAVKAAKVAGKAVFWGSILTALTLFIKGGCDAVKGGSDKEPDDPEQNRITRIGKKVTKAVVDTADATADVATTVSKTAKEEAKEPERLTSYPAFLKFITELDGSSIRGGMSWLPGSRTLRARAWTSDNPNQPLSKEQLETILNARQYYKDMHNGEIMPVAEFYKLVSGVCPSWPKDKSGKTVIRSRIMEHD